jgi:phosphate/sulfate permease
LVQEIHYAILVIHLIVGLALVYLSMKAFKKTKYPPMALLAAGFALIVVGDTIIGDIVETFGENLVGEIIEEGIEIAGFIVLILAIKRS